MTRDHVEKEVSEIPLSLLSSGYENKVIFYPIDPGLPDE